MLLRKKCSGMSAFIAERLNIIFKDILGFQRRFYDTLTQVTFCVTTFASLSLSSVDPHSKNRIKLRSKDDN